MKRCLLLLLCVLLPLQLAWAAGVGAPLGCDHHDAPMAHAASVDPGDAGDHAAHGGDAADAPCCPDASAGCGHCHGIGAPLMLQLPLTGVSLLGDEPADAAPARTSAPPAPRPERPNWAALA